MGTGPKGKWGGRRPGAGRKKTPDTSVTVVSQFLRAAKKRAKEEGRGLAEVLLDIIYATEHEPKVRIQATKTYLEVVVPKRSEIEVTKNKPGKAVQLPPAKPDPAKVIQMKGNQ